MEDMSQSKSEAGRLLFEGRFSQEGTRSGIVDSEMNSLDISGENINDLLMLSDFGVVICDDECHECFGKTIMISDKNINGHRVHLEWVVNEDWYNVRVDTIFEFNLTKAGARKFIRESVL